MKEPDSVANAFLRAVPNQLAELEYGIADTSELEDALNRSPRRGRPEVEIRRAVALVDRACRVWVAEAVGTTHQTSMAEWAAQLHEATTPEEAGHLGDMVRTVASSVNGYARLAVLSARQAADAASRITDDIPGADNSDELREVVGASARTLAACLRATRSEDEALEAAIKTADWLTTIK